MISFKDGEVKLANTSVKIGDDVHKAQSERDPVGNITVTVDFPLTPDHGTPVLITLHSENNGEYPGQIVHDSKGDLFFANL